MEKIKPFLPAFGHLSLEEQQKVKQHEPEYEIQFPAKALLEAAGKKTASGNGTPVLLVLANAAARGGR